MTLPTQLENAPRWALWVVAPAGVLLGLSFPNELLPGALRDHPPALLAWLALIPLLWAVLTLPPRAARRAAWGYGLCFALVSLSWLRLFTVLPWLLAWAGGGRATTLTMAPLPSTVVAASTVLGSSGVDDLTFIGTDSLFRAARSVRPPSA